MIREYTMTDEQLVNILDACKPTPLMFLSGGTPMGPSPQENANTAWRALGQELGFDYMTVSPVQGKPQTVFTAKSTAEDTELTNDRTKKANLS